MFNSFEIKIQRETLTPLQQCLKCMEELHYEILNLVHSRLPFDVPEKELKSLRIQVEALKRS